MTAESNPRIAWNPDDNAPFSRPIPLADHRGQTVCIEVEEGQVALVLRDAEVRCVLLPQGHRVEVGDDASAPDPQLTEKERHLNLALEQLHDELLGRADNRQLGRDDQVVFLAVDPIPDVSLESGASATVRVDDPVLFFRSFLRQSGDLSREDLSSVTRALLEDAVENAGDGSVDAQGEIATRLRTIGLDLVALRAPAEVRETAPVA